MTHVVSLDEGEEDVVVLLALVLVHCRDLVRLADQWVVGAPGENKIVLNQYSPYLR